MAKAEKETTTTNEPLSLDVDQLQKDLAEAKEKAAAAEAKAAEEAARLQAQIEQANQNNQALVEQLSSGVSLPKVPTGNPAWPCWMVIPMGAKALSEGLKPEQVNHAVDESDALRIYYARHGLNPSEFNATVQRLKEQSDASVVA